MSLLPCRDCFLMQREISQMRFICYAANQRKRGKPRPLLLRATLASLPLGIHASWNYCQRESPTLYCGRHPQNSTCVKNANSHRLSSASFPSASFKPWEQYIFQDDCVKDLHEMCSEVLPHGHKPVNLTLILKEPWLGYLPTAKRKRKVVQGYKQPVKS